MSRRNSFDLLCAQEVFRLNRDGEDPQEPPPPSAQPLVVLRRRGAAPVVRVVPTNRPAPRKI